ncbi:MAG: type II toxin-antitoxin system HicA family toxin [Chloroflexi bacterium]|nr:type II toxin-antitoxin system HicA family toxin [Chloroflexota bacterium]MCC6891864.1 type II toxin-antitoxin system HicA family toxin [Anaerolineae bacterium]
MSKLPRLSGRECVKALEGTGFYVSGQTGSHIQMRRDEPKKKITVPNHKELDKGTLRAIIRQADLTVDEFIDLL